MIHRNKSVKQIIAKVFRDLKPDNTDIVYDIVEWTGDALSYIGAINQLELNHEWIKIKNYRGLLPCNLHELQQVGYKKGDLKAEDKDSPISPMIPASSSYHKGVDTAGQVPKRPNVNKQERYVINDDSIVVEFQEGWVLILYYGFPVDEDGWPKVPANATYSEAIYWFIVTKLIEGRIITNMPFDHSYAYRMWMGKAAEAYGEGEMPDIDQYESFKRSWVRMIPYINEHDTFFDELNRQGTDNNTMGSSEYGNKGFV